MNCKRKTFQTVVALCLLIPFVSGCARGEKELFRVGVILQISDDAEKEKEIAEVVAGIRDDLNKEGGIRGRNVEIIVKNGKSDETETLLAAKRLLEIDYVHAAVCPTGGGLTPAITSAFKKGGTPLLLYGEGAEDIRFGNEWVTGMPVGGEEPGNEAVVIRQALELVFEAIGKSGRDKARIKKNLAGLISGE